MSLAVCLAGAYLTLFAVADAVLVGHGASAPRSPRPSRDSSCTRWGYG